MLPFTCAEFVTTATLNGATALLVEEVRSPSVIPSTGAAEEDEEDEEDEEEEKEKEEDGARGCWGKRTKSRISSLQPINCFSNSKH